jgi:hypothetical protein
LLNFTDSYLSMELRFHAELISKRRFHHPRSRLLEI